MRSLNETKKLIDLVSPTFCAAKWYNATIWLSNGRTASCHHPVAHHIPVESIKKNSSALHNTDYKKEQRKLMLEGQRPDECSYCWRVEDNKDENIYSDRIYKSHIYKTIDIAKLSRSDYKQDLDPKTLEIAFDNLCNLSCTYCNSEFSSTWSTDIKTNGIYPNMQTPGGHTYKHSADFTINTDKEVENPYITAFFDWLKSSLKDNLQELRVTGGEPSRSPHFWRLLEECKGSNFDFATNSNLIMTDDRLDKLIEVAKEFRNFDLYTSCESYGKHAEFVRHGLNYDKWKQNLIRFSKEAKFRNVHIMMTISALSVWTVKDFMLDILELRKQFNRRDIFSMSLNILRFPSFQSVNMIDEEYKLQLASELKQLAEDKHTEFTEYEYNQLLRLVAYLEKVDKAYEDTDTYQSKRNDLIIFLEEYSDRRDMILEEHFPEPFINWFNLMKAREFNERTAQRQ